jgi:GNAT superfamily N-acetyltransferase
MSDVMISMGYTPGAIGRVVELHARYYHHHWDFGCFFECRVAVDLCDFFERYNDHRDGFWSVAIDGRLEGSIAIDGIHADNQGAHLRWFILSERWHGKGHGKRLIGEAIRFCRKKRYDTVYLWTFAGLDSARTLYEKTGFKLVEQYKGTQWGKEVDEQRFELTLAETPTGLF